MIEFSCVTKTYPMRAQAPVTALRDVTLRVDPGEFVTVLGRSGSGKSTLLNLAAGLTPPTTGAVRVRGEDLWAMGDARRSALRNREIGFVFQFPSLIPSLDVEENVRLPGLFSGMREPGGTEADLMGILERLGIADKRRATPRQMSAGQQQRAVIARALFQRPSILLADEPTSNLDDQTEMEIVELLAQVNRDARLTIVMVTHSEKLAAAGSRTIRLQGGTVTHDEQHVKGESYAEVS
ncbi:MAG TPA: ABC transporter ATP-binding protein [Candidatus Limnocylindria bacterium]|nr:ABC transporter ATP-binding protein [Candidatus Limnocylindria bacterium]